MCVVAGSLQPPVVKAALLAGSSHALAALLALPDRAASLLDDTDKVRSAFKNKQILNSTNSFCYIIIFILCS